MLSSGNGHAAFQAKPKTAFRTPTGALWQFTVAPFGLVNLPSVFTRLMHHVLGETLGVFACVYIDDILVFSKTTEEHIRHLDIVLKKIIAAGLNCSVHKSVLFRTQIKFVGHIVDKSGISPDPEKIRAVVDIPPPCKDGKPELSLVQTVCGLFNYYRR